MSPVRALLVALALLFWCAPARAHETRTVQIDIEALAETEARVVIRPARSSVMAEGCRFDASPSGASGVLRCDGPLAGRTVAVSLAEVDLAFVRMTGFAAGDAESVVTRTDRTVTLPGEAAASGVVLRFLRLGGAHVFGGLDHVLFLLALFWQARSGGRTPRATALALLRTATAFTAGHSLTLAATALGVLHVPPRIAEACIAASLVLVALDLGRAAPAGGGDRQRTLLAGAFGLVHGLGFAGALAETGLPEGARAAALLCFNVGVELGQIAIFAASGLALVLVRRASRRLDDARLAGISAYVVGALGAAMFFLRTAAIFR